MAARDDMVIRPLLRRGKNKSVREKVQERAQEERRTSHERRKKRRLLKRLRRARSVRKTARARKLAAKGAKPGLGTAAAKGAAQAGAAGAARAAVGVLGSVVTLIAILAEAVIQGGRAARRFSGGHSGRLVDATDADTLYGGLDEEIAADLAAVSFVEGNEDLLRIIGKQGKVNGQISDLLNEKRRVALMQLQGADAINRSPDLDAPETILDMLIAKAHREGLRGKADQAAAAIRTKSPNTVHIGGHVPGFGR